MIIYGSREKVLKQSPFPGHSCTNCGQEDTYMVVSCLYGHIFWIPLFPVRKTLRVVCANCKHVAKPKELGGEVRGLANKLKKSVRYPLYMYSGLGVIALIVIGFMAVAFMSNQRYKKYLETPQVNDIYFLENSNETSEFAYYLWKVIVVEGDSVHVSPNAYQYNSLAITKLEPEDGFYDVFYTYHKNQLKELYDTDVLKKVVRGYSEQSGFDREIEYVE